jgi:hypothetical protein
LQISQLDAQQLVIPACVLGDAVVGNDQGSTLGGWVPLPDAYNDGGFSGGTLNRPAIQRLLDDVREGFVDVIVVYLYKLFQNPVFIGVAAYKGKHFAGEHDAILDRDVWEQVQAMLGRGEPEQRARQNRPSRAPALLKGLIFADDGWAMTPGATHKGDKVYRYYVNTASMKIGKEACSVSRVPAGEIEAAVIAQVRKVLQAPEVMSQAIREVVALDPAADAQQVITTLQSIEPVWDELFPAEQARIIQLLVERVTVSPTGLRIDMKTAGMRELIQSVMPERKAA